MITLGIGNAEEMKSGDISAYTRIIVFLLSKEYFYLNIFRTKGAILFKFWVSAKILQYSIRGIILHYRVSRVIVSYVLMIICL